jgi:hypothetical protein
MRTQSMSTSSTPPGMKPIGVCDRYKAHATLESESDERHSSTPIQFASCYSQWSDGACRVEYCTTLGAVRATLGESSTCVVVVAKDPKKASRVQFPVSRLGACGVTSVLRGLFGAVLLLSRRRQAP